MPPRVKPVLSRIEARFNGARDALAPRRSQKSVDVASGAYPSGYDSTSPYMEQNGTKRGAH